MTVDPIIQIAVDKPEYEPGDPISVRVSENFAAPRRSIAITGLSGARWTVGADDGTTIEMRSTIPADISGTSAVLHVELTRSWDQKTATGDYTVAIVQPVPGTGRRIVGVSLSNKGNQGGLDPSVWDGHRIYIPDACPSDITSHSDIQRCIRYDVDYVVLSWKDTNLSNVSRMLDSFSKLPDEMVVDAVYFHEMEDNMSGSAFLRDAIPQRRLVQERGIAFGNMYQAWTYNPKSGRRWQDWYDPDVDFHGVEAYNPGRKKTPPVFEPPADFLDRVFDAFRQTGKPTVAGEFGMPVDPRDPDHRPQYIKDIVGYYDDNCPVPVRSLLYWDSVVSNDNRLDRAAAEALVSLNS